LKRVATILFFLALAGSVRSQTMDSTLRMSAMIGAGWTHYYNNLIAGREGLKNNFLGSSFRLMWEPEHRLSVGLETGHYKLYDASLQPGNGTASVSIIPLMANFRMRILKGFYLTGGTGIALLKSELNSASGSSKSQTISYSDVQLSALYLYNLSPQLSVGGELKFLWIDKTDDFATGLQAVVRWRF
jgi:hypothetical protein